MENTSTSLCGEVWVKHKSLRESPSFYVQCYETENYQNSSCKHIVINDFRLTRGWEVVKIRN